jgi:hypothetical protein
MIRLIALLVAAAPALAEDPVPASAPELPPPALQVEIDRAIAACAGFENGTATLEAGSLSQHDLAGDRVTDDWVFDLSHVACSSAASLYCGTGGCGLFLVVGDTITERLARGWTVTSFGSRQVVLLDVHGSLCGGVNWTPCVEALVWDEENGGFASVLP